MNSMNYEINCTATTIANANKQEPAIKSKQDTVKELRAVRNSILESKNETTNLQEAYKRS